MDQIDRSSDEVVSVSDEVVKTGNNIAINKF